LLAGLGQRVFKHYNVLINWVLQDTMLGHLLAKVQFNHESMKKNNAESSHGNSTKNIFSHIFIPLVNQRSKYDVFIFGIAESRRLLILANEQDKAARLLKETEREGMRKENA